MILRFLSLFLLLATTSIPAYSQVFGSLANFDVVNDTGKTAHGFEIEIHDIHTNNITSIFGAANRWPNMERYGSPSVAEFSDASGFGVRIRYQSAYNGSWSVGTPSGTLPVNPADSCWPLGAKAYGPLYPCDHFGVSTNVATPNVKYSWLVETTPGSSSLSLAEATVPNPVFTVTPVDPILVQPPAPPGEPLPPPVLQPQPPAVHVAIAAPAPNHYEFGEPRWVKVTATGTLQDVAVEDLVAENAVIQKARTQTQLEWQLLQTDIGNPAAGQIDLTGVALDDGAAGVVYRFEFYKYTGNRDPATNEAKVGPNGDTPGINGPSPGDLGDFIVAQNAGINFDGGVPAAPPLPIAPALNATIVGAIVGQAYDQPISVTPANPGDVISIDVTGLPNGLSFDSVANAIVGTPTQAGNFPLIIVATDITNGLSTTAATSIDVAFAPVVFSASFLNGTVNTPYSQVFSATGNGAISYSILEALPDGLTLSGDTVSGTPTTAGSYSLTVTAKDAQGFSANSVATLLIEPAPVVAPPPPPPAPVACSGTNEIISFLRLRNPVYIDIAGGVAQGGKSVYIPPQDATVINPPLTAANAFNPGNLASYTGTMDQAGVFCQASQMTLAQGLTFAPIALVNGQVDVAYTPSAITPTGGIQPYTVVVSNLPNGMSFNGTEISGTPQVAGPYTVGISVNDSNGQSVFYNADLVIDPAPLALNASPVAAMVGVPMSFGPVSATGGVGPYTYAFTGLPAWAIAGATGFSGTPDAAGSFTFVLTATDSKNASVSTNVAITVDPAPVIISGALGNGQVGINYSGSLTATGGNGALNWSVTGAIPGVNFANGVFSGTPSTAGTYKLVVTAADAYVTSASATYTVTIANPVAPPPASCTKPANAKSFAVSKQKITAVTATTITVGGKVVQTGCATVSWNGAKTFRVGDFAEVSKGFTVNGINTATKITIN